jgi:hypothetical protein
MSEGHIGVSESNTGGRKFVQPGKTEDQYARTRSPMQEQTVGNGSIGELWQALGDLVEYTRNTFHEILTRVDVHALAISDIKADGIGITPPIPIRLKLPPDQLAQLLYNHIMAAFHFPSPWAQLDPAVKAGYVQVAEQMLAHYDVYIKSTK